MEEEASTITGNATKKSQQHFVIICNLLAAVLVVTIRVVHICSQITTTKQTIVFVFSYIYVTHELSDDNLTLTLALALTE